jgi:hypothetical protein
MGLMFVPSLTGHLNLALSRRRTAASQRPALGWLLAFHQHQQLVVRGMSSGVPICTLLPGPRGGDAAYGRTTYGLLGLLMTPAPRRRRTHLVIRSGLSQGVHLAP